MKKIFTSYLPAILVSSIFLIPMVSISDFYNGTDSGKNYCFYIFMTILIFYNILFYIFNKSKKVISINKIDLILLSLIIWNLFTALISQDSYVNEKTIELFLLTIFYFIVKGQLTSSENQIGSLLISTVFIFTIAIAEVIIGILQLYYIIPSNNPYFRITGTFHNPTPFALFLTIIYAYALAGYSFNVVPNKVIRYLALVCCLLILTIIPFTLNRASWIGIFFSTLFICLYKLIQSKLILKLHILKKISFVTIIIVLVGASAPYLYSFKKGSSDGRILVWKVSGKIIKEHPFFGIGYGSFHSVYNIYQADYFIRSHDKQEESLAAGDVRFALNDYIQILVETGVVGLLLFVGLIFLVLNSYKLKQNYINSFICPFITFLILSLVSYPINALSTEIIFFFLLASISSFVSNHENNASLINLNKWVFLILLIVFIPISLKQAAKYQKYKLWLLALIEYNSGNYEDSELYYRQIYNDLKYERNYSRMFAECLYKNQKHTEALDVLVNAKVVVPDPELFILMGNLYRENKQYSMAFECFENARYMVPGRILPKYYLMKTCFETGDTIKAKDYIKEILDMNIKISSDLTQKIIREIRALQ